MIGTPRMKIIHWAEHETYCDLIANAIRLQQIANPHSRLGTGKGWSGEKNLFQLPVMKSLKDFLQFHTDCKLTGWANVLEQGDFIGQHHHNDGKNVISGVYYLSLAYLSTDENVYAFEPGDIAIFKPELNHWVEPSSDPLRRITIAFNGVK